MNLWESIIKNNLETIKKNIAMGVDINQTNKDGLTPLMFAFVKNRITIAKFLIETGADVNYINNQGQNVLYYVSSINQAKILLKTPINISQINNCGEQAINTIKNPTICALISKHMKLINEQFLSFCKTGRLVDIISIIKRGADINYCDEAGENGLIAAIRFGKRICAKYLISIGANVNIVDNNGNTALYWASKTNDIEITKMLIDAGCNINAQNKNGQTALMNVACTGWDLDQVNNNQQYAKLLIENGANLELTDSHGKSAFIIAALWGVTWFIELLINSGADIYKKTKEGYDALYYAKQNYHANTADIIKKAFEKQQEKSSYNLNHVFF